MAFFAKVDGKVHVFQTQKDDAPACNAAVSLERVLPDEESVVCEQCEFCAICWGQGGALRYAGARS